MDIDPQTLKQATPGLLGALGSVFFMTGPWALRIGLVAPGVALSYYAYETVAKISGMNEGLAGFTVGLLGMIFVAKVIATWNALDLGTALTQWIRKLLRLDAQ